VGEVDQRSGKKSSFREAQQKSQRIKLRRGVDECHTDTDDSQRDHNAREPAARAPFLDDDGAGNFQQEVTSKENPGAEAEDAVVEAELPRHL